MGDLSVLRGITDTPKNTNVSFALICSCYAFSIATEILVWRKITDICVAGPMAGITVRHASTLLTRGGGESYCTDWVESLHVSRVFLIG